MLGILNFARISLIKRCRMLQNARLQLLPLLRLMHQLSYFAHNFQKPIIITKIFGLLKIVCNIQQRVLLTLKKKNCDVILYLCFTSYLLPALVSTHFWILPHSETIQNTKKLPIFGEKEYCRFYNFLETFFEVLIIFLEPATKSI